MIQELPHLHGVPIRLPFRSAAVVIPELAFANTMLGNVP